MELQTHNADAMSRALVLAVVAGLASGCASVTGVHSQSLSLQTLVAGGRELSGATCVLTNSRGKWFVTTPGSLVINRSNDDMQVLCTKPGVDAGRAIVASETRGVMFGNIFAGGGIGAVIDHNNGAAYEYPPLIQVLMGSLTRIGSAKSAEQAAMARPVSSAIAMPSLIASDSTARPAIDAEQYRNDPCKEFIEGGEKCWWSPPGAYSVCPTVATLQECTSYYGKGCRIGHGRSLPGC